MPVVDGASVWIDFLKTKNYIVFGYLFFTVQKSWLAPAVPYPTTII